MNLNKVKMIIWEVVGLALGVLFLLGILAIFIGIGYGIYQYKRHHVVGVAVEPGKDKEMSDLKLTVQYELPLPVEASDFFIIPVTLKKKKQNEERGNLRSDVLSERSVSPYDGGMNSDIYRYNWGPYYNLVFVNKKTGVARPLLDRKGYIGGVYFPEKKYNEKEAEKKPTFMLLKIAAADTNHDGVINGKDALPGFVASLDGTSLTQVTPDNTQMRGWRYDADTQTLFLEVVQDVNKDHKFNVDNPMSVVSVNALNPKIGQEFIPGEIKSKIESLLKK